MGPDEDELSHHMQLNNTFLGTFTVSNISPGMATTQTVNIKFGLDLNGILQITARHRGRPVSIEIDYGANRTNDQKVNTILREAEKNKDHDANEYRRLTAREDLSIAIEMARYRLKHVMLLNNVMIDEIF